MCLHLTFPKHKLLRFEGDGGVDGSCLILLRSPILQIFFNTKQEKLLTELQSSVQEHRLHPRKMRHCPLHPNIQDPNTLRFHHTKISVLKGLFFHKTLHWFSSIQLFHLNEIKTLWEQQLQSPHFFFSGALLDFLVQAQCK